MIGKTLSGRYRLQSKLGSGGMSTVYLAHDENLDRPVAVKIMHAEISDQPDQLVRFRREARTVARISHPNVVSVIDAGEDDGHPYIVFEYVEGETLKARIDRLHQLPTEEAVAFAIEIGRGLAAAHANQLVHRDVKPQNVLIDRDGRAKVTDFGIARALEESESEGLTKAGRVLGTTDYVSPEQALGHDVDPRSDIYSLGVVLYEMLAGRLPFEAETVVGVAMKHVKERPPDIRVLRPGISAMLAQTVDRALSKDPARRYDNIQEMLVDLEQALTVEVAGEDQTGSTTTVMERLRAQPKPEPRRVIGMAVVILVLAAALVVAVLAMNGGNNPAPDVADATNAPASGTTIPISSLSTFDPPPGDGAEADELLTLAIDDDPATMWTSEHYATEDLSGLKDGVGVVIETGMSLPRALHVISPTPGWDAEVFAATGQTPTDLAGWGERIGSVTAAPEETAIQLTALEEHDRFLLWFTKLPPSSTDPSRFRAQLAEIRLTD